MVCLKEPGANAQTRGVAASLDARADTQRRAIESMDALSPRVEGRVSPLVAFRCDDRRRKRATEQRPTSMYSAGGRDPIATATRLTNTGGVT
jgi:hypothetical protein